MIPTAYYERWAVITVGKKRGRVEEDTIIREEAYLIRNLRNVYYLSLRCHITHLLAPKIHPRAVSSPKILQVILILGSIPYPRNPERLWFQRVVRCEDGAVWQRLGPVL